MSRFHLPFSVIMLSSFTSIRGRVMHDGADSPIGFISHMLQMSNQASIPNPGLCVLSYSPSSKQRYLRFDWKAGLLINFSQTSPVPHTFLFKSWASDAVRKQRDSGGGITNFFHQFIPRGGLTTPPTHVRRLISPCLSWSSRCSQFESMAFVLPGDGPDSCNSDVSKQICPYPTSGPSLSRSFQEPSAPTDCS